MKNIKLIMLPLLLIVIAILIPPKQVNAYSIYIEKGYINSWEIAIGSGNKVELRDTYKKKDAVYSYYSNNKKVVEVYESSGKLKGIKAGEAVITCKEKRNGKITVIGTCKVTVKNVSVEEGPNTIGIGQEFIMGSCMEYTNSEAVYQYTSSKPSVASISKNGVVKGIKVGTTKITVKEVLKGKSRTVGATTIQVVAATISESSAYYILSGASKEGFVILTTDALMKPEYFLDNSIREATYKFISEDESMMRVEKRGEDIYLLPQKPGVTMLTVEETYKGKTRTVGTVYVGIDLRKYLRINEYYLTTFDTPYVTVSEGKEGNFRSLLEMTDIKGYSIDIDVEGITFTSDNTSVVEIDKETGVFQAKEPGTAIITATCQDSLVKIKMVVAKKGTFGEDEIKGEIAIESINSLVQTEITKENASDLWNKIDKLNQSIGYFPNMDWQEEEPYLYRVKGEKRYWAVPNFYKLKNFSKEVIDVLRKEANELLAKQEIVNITDIKKDSVIIEFKYPITRNYYTYYQAISVEGSAYGAMVMCDIINTVNGKTGYGLMQIKDESNKIKVAILSEALEKGTYSLKCSEDVCAKAFEFTLK